MMLKFILFCFTIFFPFHLLGQSQFRNFYPVQNSYYDDFAIQTSDSGYAFISHSLDSANHPKSFSLAKTDRFGNIIWAYSYDINTSYLTAASFVELSDHSFAIGCNSNNRLNYWRIDSTGQVLFVKSYLADSIIGLSGGNPDASGNNPDLTIDQDGNLLFGAATFGLQFWGGGFCNWFLKIDDTGNPIWSLLFRKDTVHGSPTFRRVKATINKGYFGYDNFIQADSTGNLFMYMDVFKIDSSGNVQWLKQIGQGYNPLACGSTSLGDFLISGLGPDDNFLMKINSFGNVIWTKNYPSYFNWPRSIFELTNGNYLFTYNHLGTAPYATIIDTSGNPLMTNAFLSSTFDAFYTVNRTFDNGFIAVGESDLGGFILVKADSILHSGCNEFNPVIGQDTSSHIDSAGFIQMHTNVTVTDITANVIVTSASFTLMDECLMDNILSMEKNFFSFEISPNPTSSTFTITTPAQLQNAQVEIYNVVGEKMYSAAFNLKLQTLNLKLAPGIYLVKLQIEKGSAVKKLVVE